MNATLAEAGVNPTDQDDTRQDAQTGPDPDAGKLFDVPRVGVIIDETDPTVIKLSFSGGIELNRANASDVKFFNTLNAGQSVNLEVEAHVAGAKTTHRRDSEGNVDAVVTSKSLIVHSLDGIEAE